MEGLGHVVVADAEEAEAAFDAFDDGALVFADSVDGSGELHDLSVKLSRALEVLGGCGVIHLDVEFRMQIGTAIDAAVTAEQIYFVPYLLPGATENVEVWSPSEGKRLAGSISFVPHPGTDWAAFDPAPMQNIIDALDNEAIYRSATALLGDDLTGVITGLLVGGGYETTPSGIVYSSGCVPHACGVSDSFMGVDQAGQKLYFAQGGAPAKAWPSIDQWPADLAKAMKSAIGFE